MSARACFAVRALGVALLAQLLPSCWLLAWNPGKEIPEYTGVEEPSLVTRARGTLLWFDPGDDDRLGVLDVATGARSAVEIDRAPIGISGPDELGRVALLEPNSWWRSNHRLSVVSLRDGSQRTLLEGDRELYRYSSATIAPRGGRIAFVRRFDLGGYSYSAPELLLVDASSGAVAALPVDVPDDTQPRWFPDGQRLAYVELAADPLEGETWILDVASGVRTRLCRGRIFALSVDGSLALVRVADEATLVDATSGSTVRPGALAPLPAGYRTIVALLEPDLVIHHGAPPAGERQELVGAFGVQGGARYPIRLTDLDVDRSAVLVPKTSGWLVSFGSVELAHLETDESP